MTKDLISQHLRVAEAAGAVPKPKSHRSLINYVQVAKKITLDPWQRDLCNRLEKAFWLSRAEWLEEDYEEINIGAGEAYIETPSGFRISMKEYETMRGRATHAAIHAPPQLGKTVVISQSYPSWILGFDPTHRFRMGSNSITHSRTVFSEPTIQLLRSPEHAEFFPSEDSRIPERLNALKWSTNARKAIGDGQSSFSALGLQSGFVGTGFDCLPAGSMIQTELGDYDIADLYRQKRPFRVYGFDHNVGQVVLKRIVATRRKRVNGLVEITTKKGRKFHCTPNHRIFIEGVGYKLAGQIQKGDPLTAFRMSSVHGTEGRQVGAMQEVPRSKLTHRTNLHMVSGQVSETAMRSRKTQSERTQRLLLLSPLLGSSSCNKKLPSALQISQMSERSQAGAMVLLREVPYKGAPVARRSIAEGAQPTMRGLPNGVLSETGEEGAVLLGALREQGAFAEDDRKRELSLQRRNQLCLMVRPDASVNPSPRPEPLRGVRENKPTGDDAQRPASQPASCSPHRREPAEQRAGQSHYPVQELPHDPPSIEEDSVAVVRHLRTKPVYVYDLQVEDCHNFFANEILVHNSLILDDPFKSDEEAMSEIIRDKCWRFYTNTAHPRWSEHSNEFIMFHRYHQDDMAGRALLTGYFQLWRYAAEADGDYLDEETEQTFPCLPIGRPIGEYLSARKTNRWWGEQKRNEGIWSAQFQGRPSTKSGKIFDITLFQFIQSNQLPKMVATVRAWDNASTEGGGAYSAGVKVGIDAAENVYIFDVVRKQVGTAERELLQRQTADRDGKLVHIHGPEDPGSAGSDIAFDFEQTFQRLGFTASTDKAGAREDAAGQRSHNRTKIQRAYVASKTVNSSKAYIIMVQDHKKDCAGGSCACPWTMPKWWKKFKSECAFFPAGTYKDQVDAFSDAHNYLKRVFYRGLVVKNASNLNLLHWSLFRSRFGEKIPGNFEVSCGVRMAPDSSKPSGFCIVARAAENALLGEVVFAVAAERMFVSDPLEVLIRLRRALERTCENGERHARIIYYNSDAPKVFHVAAQKLDMYIAEFKEEITAGLREMNWYVDPLPGIRSPFYDRIGTSRLLVLVDDRQLLDHDILDEDGMLSLRQDFGNWSYNEHGLPQLYGGIILDCMRMTLYRFALSAVGLTDDERKFARLPQHLQPQEVVKLKGTPQFVETILAQEHALTIDRIRQYEDTKRETREANRNGSFFGKHAVVRRFRKAM